MKKMIQKTFIALWLVFLAGPVWAVDEIGFVRDAYAHLSTVAEKGSVLSDATMTEVRALFDFDSFAHLCLQDIEGKMTPTQLADFKVLFADLFFTNISKKGTRLADKNLVNIKYTLENRGGNRSTVTVNGRVKDQNVTLQFALIRNGDAWKIEDMSVEGAGLSRNYRGQFNRIFREEHYEGLTSRMQKKLADMTNIARKDK